jgi:HEAT repeat protein
MKRRRLLWVGGILAGLLVGLPVLLWSGYAALALYRHEHFYHGLPSSWWRRQVTRLGLHWVTPPPPTGTGRYLHVALALSQSRFAPVTNYLGISQLPDGTGLFGDPAAAPVLCDFIRDGDEDACLMAAQALSQMHLHPEVAIPALIAFLKEDRPPPYGEACSWAMGCLQNFGPQAAPAVPALLDRLNRKRRETVGDARREQLTALQALRAIDPDNMELLIGLLEHPSREIKQQTMITLSHQFGPKAKAAVPALVKMITQRDKREYLGLYRPAALTLLRIDPEAAHKAGVPKGYN